GLAAADRLHTLYATDDQPDHGQDPKNDADHDDRSHQRDDDIEKPDPEGANLKAVMTPDPFRGVRLVDIGHDQPDESGHADQETDQIEDIDRGGGVALGRVAGASDRVDSGRAGAFRHEIDDRTADRDRRPAPIQAHEIVALAVIPADRAAIGVGVEAEDVSLHSASPGAAQAALARFAARRLFTVATVWSTIGLCMPNWAPIICTSWSVRSILGTPLLSARAAEEGRTSSCAALAYFSNGTRSAGSAPSLVQTSSTQL